MLPRTTRLPAAVLLGCLAATLLTPHAALAQVLYGTIVGNVKDSTDAAVPGATVTITHRETNQTRTAESNDQGSFSFPTIPSGTYQLRVTKEGFRPVLQDNLPLSANATARADLTLQVGSVAETVEVSAQAQLLQTDRAEVRQEITTKQLTDIPVPGQRNYQALFITIPGISPPSTPHSIPSNPSRSMSFSTNGTNTASNNVRIDGASATNVWLPHISSYVPALESIEAVNVVTNSFDAEQGLAGGASVNVNIRSGSNELRGAGFWYHMGNWSQSRPFFLPSNQGVPKFVYNQNGGRLGGPILKDKIFFFGSYEGTYDRRFAFRRVNVPTAEMRRGDLSASPTTIYDPATGNPDGSGRRPFAGNIIPADRINPLSRRLLELLPLPNVPGAGLTQNYYAGSPFNFDRHTVDSKFNFNLNEKWTAYARLSWLKFNTFNQTTFGEAIGGAGINNASNPGTGFGHTWTYTVATTYVLTPTFIIDAYHGYTLMDANVEQPGLGTNIGRETYGIPGVNGTRYFESGFPGFGLGGFEAFGSTETFMPYYRHDPQYQYVANANWTRGAHNIRFGFDIYRLQLNHNQPEFAGSVGGASGRLNFNQGPTQALIPNPSNPNATITAPGSQFNSIASFLLGYSNEGGRLLQVPEEYTTRTAMYSFYVRDQWQVNRQLTLNYGTRYEYFPMPSRTDRGTERYDFQRNLMLVCGVGQVPKDCGTKVGKFYFSPRLGVAYRATDRTVVRAGFGLNWDPWNLARPLRTNYPIHAVLNVQSPAALSWATTLPGTQVAPGSGPTQVGLPEIPTPQVSQDGTIPIPGNFAVNTTDEKFTRGYVLNWNATVERQLPWNFVGQAGYVANRSIHISGFVDLNAGQVIGADRAGQPLFQQFGRQARTALMDGFSYSTYHSLQAQLNRRFANGIQFNTAYTWSKAIGFCCNDDNNGTPLVQAIPYLYLNRTLLNSDRTHNLQLSGVFELPFGRGRRFAPANPVVSAVVSGWQLNTLTSILSGTPFNVTSDGGSLRLPGSTQRADQVKAEVTKLGGIGPGQPYYDRSAYARVTEARFGTAGFNSLRGPGAFSSDLSLFRRFAMNERTNLEFRAEAFNWTNTPKFSNPNGDITSVNFMLVTGTNSLGRDVAERMIRLGLRLSF